MDRRGIVEVLGGALVSGGLAAVALQLFVGRVAWVPVVGLAAAVGIAAAANYRARVGHAEQVATEAPEVTAQKVEEYTRPTAGDGGERPEDDSRD